MEVTSLRSTRCSFSSRCRPFSCRRISSAALLSRTSLSAAWQRAKSSCSLERAPSASSRASRESAASALRVASASLSARWAVCSSRSSWTHRVPAAPAPSSITSCSCCSASPAARISASRCANCCRSSRFSFESMLRFSSLWARSFKEAFSSVSSSTLAAAAWCADCQRWICCSSWLLSASRSTRARTRCCSASYCVSSES
mmetsp:Transcript_75641/g.213822  ORF Transcript_75641/g.213822 Transcript_75641/m.213822 type:complete len:201 (+) Transcript_75641:341-943(+)